MKYRAKWDREVVQTAPLRRREPSAGLAALDKLPEQEAPRGRPVKEPGVDLNGHIGLGPDDAALTLGWASGR